MYFFTYIYLFCVVSCLCFFPLGSYRLHCASFDNDYLKTSPYKWTVDLSHKMLHVKLFFLHVMSYIFHMKYLKIPYLHYMILSHVECCCDKPHDLFYSQVILHVK